MKAIQFTGYGETSDKIILSDIPVPVPSDHEVLVKAVAASLNPIDYKLVNGRLKQLLKFRFPQRLGYDVSGQITAIGKNVSSFKTGDEIYSRVGTKSPGTFAEYICIEEKYLALKPAKLSHREASCIPLTGLTTMQAMLAADAKAGKKILIHAGSGGVGVFAIQYAKALGLFVATTTSTGNVSWVKDLGADVVIDYKKQDYTNLLKDYDIVYDTLGGDTTLRSFDVLRKGGTVVSISGPPDAHFAAHMQLNFLYSWIFQFMSRKVRKKARLTGTNYRYLLMTPGGKQLEELNVLLEQGKIKPLIDKVFPLSETISALKYLETGRVKGKVVIDCINPIS